ncbi:hypothetical protein ILT44_12460 [Microvirga sp. BT689]|uniref:hypothetical protein n=1 Tax=Microvirga arvi TaxID=2778731 RepID=UPI001951875F|nr:hypothetical protein [Microvirga arvi]MBM6580998.1 hypothetical protein [Microvirga arvi]
MVRIFLSVIVCALAFSAGAEGAPSRKRNTPVQERTSPSHKALEQDEFRSCDVAIREFVQGRKEAAALPVKEVKADGLRMTLNFVHPYGESGDTPPNLAFTRGESIEERRSALNEAKQKARMLAEAAKTGSVWYVIVLKKESDSGDERRSPASAQAGEGHHSIADAVVMASIDGRCITVSQYASIPLGSLSGELRQLLGQREQEASPAETSPQPPPS